VGEVYTGLDPAMFTTHDEALGLLWNSLRSSLNFSLYGNRSRFTAQVLSPCVNIDASAALAVRSGQADPASPETKPWSGRKIFKGRIIGPESPHKHLPDPCKLAKAAKPHVVISQIAMHTTFIIEDEELSAPNVNDYVTVELYPGFGKGRYNLQMGACISIANSNADKPDTYTCIDSPSDLFTGDNMSTVGANGPGPRSSNYNARKGSGKESKGQGRNISAGAAALPRPKYDPSETKKVDFAAMAAAFDGACSVSDLGGDINELKKAKPDPSKYFGKEGWKIYKEALSYFEGSTNSTNPYGYYGRWQFGVPAMVSGGAIKETEVKAALIKSFNDMNKKGGKYEGFFTGKDVQAQIEARANWCYKKNSDGTTGQKFCKAQRAGGTENSNIRCCGQHIQNAYADPNVWTKDAHDNNVKSGAEFLKSSDYQHKILIPFTAGKFRDIKALGALTNVKNPAAVAGLLAAAHIAGQGAAAELAAKGLDIADANGTPASYYFQAIGQTMFDKNNGCKKASASTVDPNDMPDPSI